jgi:aryl-alcohol dehydrogenase-like predicted oxidoreductase
MVKKEEDWAKIGNGGGAATGFQSQCPYLQGANLAENIKTLAPLEEQAALLGVSAATLSLTWLHAQGEDVFPIPGTTKITNLENNVATA